jgi:hypothetical protein
MEFVQETPTAYFIRIIPKLQIDREEYIEALVRLSRPELKPVAIRLTSPNGKETKEYRFKAEDVIENRQISPAWFDGPKMVADLTKKQWTVVVNPGPNGQPQDQAPAAVGARPAAGAAAGKAAAKGQAGGVRQR